MKLLLLSLLAATSIHSSAAAEEAPGKQGGGISITLQVFAGRKATLQPLSRELMAPGTNAKALAQLDQLASAGSIELTSEVLGQISADSDFTAFQGEVVRYPINFDRPEMITARSDPKAAAPAANSGPPAFGFGASTYESRNLGTSLSLRTFIHEDGRGILVSADWKRSWLVQWDEFEVGRLPNNEKMLLKQPRFAEAGSQGNFNVVSGERTLLGIHAVPGAPDRVEIVLMALEVSPAKPK